MSGERPALPARGELRFWTTEKLRNADTDQFRHVNNAVIASLLEAGRMEIFADAQARPLLDALTLAVVRLEIDFHCEVFYPGAVEIGSRVLHVGRTSFRVRQGVFEGDRCVASALATCVLFDPATRRAAEVPTLLREFLLRVS